jgi:hypothetical protein
VLEPEYGELAERTLDAIEHDKERRPLWNAILDAIDLVCDHPESAQAMRERIEFPEREFGVWQVAIHCRDEDEDWVLWWHRERNTAVIPYIGRRIFR